MLRSLVLALLLLLVVAAVPAGAGTLSSERGTTVFRADPGEINHISLSQDPRFGLELTDTGGPLSFAEGANCASGGANTATCGDVAARLHCGDGVDLVDEPYEDTFVAADCEHVSFQDTLTLRAHPVAVTRKSAVFVAHCPTDVGPRATCQGRFALTAQGTIIAFKRFRHQGRSSFLVRLGFTRRSQRLVSRHDGVTVTVGVRMSGLGDYANKWLVHIHR